MTDLLNYYVSAENQPEAGGHFVASQFPNGTAYGQFGEPDTSWGSGSALALHEWTDVWQTGILAGGMLAAYNVLSEGNASHPGALLARRLAYEYAVTATTQYFDNRDGSSTRNVIVRRETINGPQGRASLDGPDGRANARDRTLRGSQSGATGVVMYPGYNTDFGDATEIFLKNVVGDFDIGEPFTIDGTTVTGTVSHIRKVWHGAQSMRVFPRTSAPNDNRELTAAEHGEDALFTNLNNETFWIARNLKWYYAYRQWQIAGVQVAKIAAEANYYGARNAEILARATDIIESLFATEQGDPGAQEGWDDFTEWAAVAQATPGGDGEIHNVGGFNAAVGTGTSRVDLALEIIQDSEESTVNVQFGNTAIGTAVSGAGGVDVGTKFGRTVVTSGSPPVNNSGRVALRAAMTASRSSRRREGFW
jgi:hypothetical protein